MIKKTQEVAILHDNARGGSCHARRRSIAQLSLNHHMDAPVKSLKSPFPNITDKQWNKLVEDKRQVSFLARAQEPIMWQLKARQHKRSADIIYEAARAADERRMSRLAEEIRSGMSAGSHTVVGQEREDMLDQDLIEEYCLLIGYTLECLLKGYLLAVSPELVAERHSYR